VNKITGQLKPINKQSYMIHGQIKLPFSD